MDNFFEPLVQVKDQILLVLALVAGSGGIMYWIDRWRNRVRLYVEILSIDDLFFEIEVENLGAIPSSLRKWVEVRGYVAESDKGIKCKNQKYEIVSPDRKLPPREPKRFSCHIPKSAQNTGEDFSLVMARYVFRPTIGQRHVVYSQGHKKQFDDLTHRVLPDSISLLSYWYGVTKQKIG